MGYGSLTLLLLMAVWTVVTTTRQIKKYPHKFDYVNIDYILNNDSLRDEMYHCVYGDGPCTSKFAKFYKERYPEILRTNCARCTDAQKKIITKVRNWYKKNRPQERCAILEKIILKDTSDFTAKGNML